MADRLVVFASSPNQQPFPHRPDCSFQSLYHSHVPDNVNSWQFFPNDESICVFIQDEPLNTKEMTSIENNTIPKGLTPLESLFSSSDVGNKEKKREEGSRRNMGETYRGILGHSNLQRMLK
jgi:hypothetical protein